MQSRKIRTFYPASLFILLILVIAGTRITTAAELRLAVLGNAEEMSGLNEEEQAAYQWAISEFETEYIRFEKISNGEVSLYEFDVLWWHYDAEGSQSNFDLPSEAVTEQVITAINEFVTSGGGLFLSKYATQYTVDLGIQSIPPDEIVRNPTSSGAWGYYKMIETHPVFDGLNNPFATLSSELSVDNAICWWTDPDLFEGIWLTDLEWRSDSGPDIVSSGEFGHGDGMVIFTGAGAFEWHHPGTNTNRANLEQYTANIIRYLKPPVEITVTFLVENTSAMAGEQQLIYDWLDARSFTQVERMAYADLEHSNVPEFTDVIWWHYTESETFPAVMSQQTVIDRVKTAVSEGIGLKLSGLAAAWLDELGLAPAPDRREIYTGTPEATALNIRIPSHQIFSQLEETVQLRSDDSVENRVAVWTDPSVFPGTWLASDDRRQESVALGTLALGTGRVLVAGTEAYSWEESIDTDYYDDLTRLARNILRFLTTPAPEIVDGLVLHFPLDGRFEDHQTTEKVSGREVTVTNNYDRPEWVAAPTGSGLRLDGFSTWVTWNEPPEDIPSDQITVELWAAVESYPPRNAPFVNNYTFPNRGYYMGMEPLGAWYFALSIDGEWYTVWGDGPFPKYEWAHIAGVFDKDEGLRLYRNGQLVGAQATPAGRAMTPDLESPTIIGRDIHTDYVAVFPTGVINGIVDDVRIYNTSRSGEQIRQQYDQGTTTFAPKLEAPESRYADDPHRPGFHPIPPAHWANEPHGLVYHDDRYHLFYQYNPSGPYWAHIHWGHMSTPDLVQWDDHPIALSPEPGFDSYGIWSGDAVVHEGRLKAIYTGVDGARARVGLAEMYDYGDFRKHPANPLFHLPPGNFEDFRDPYVWYENDYWYLLIGSGVPHGGGGTSLLYRSQNLVNWDFRGEVMGEGDPAESGEYWEMPMIKHLEDGIHYFGVTDLPIGRNTYWLGHWENETFTPMHDGVHRLDLINRFLSPAIERTPDGRIVAVGIIPNHVSTEYAQELGWEHVFSFPREWYYHEEDQTLGQRPAKELEILRGRHERISMLTIGDGRSDVIPHLRSTQFELIADIAMSSIEQAGVILRATPDRQEQTRIYYNKQLEEIVVDLSQASNNPQTERDIRRAPFKLKEGERLKLHVFVDNSVIEVFVNDKQALATRAFPMSLESDGIDVFASGGVTHANIDFWELDPTYVTSVEDEKGVVYLPEKVKLHANYPNPFNPSTVIAFSLPEESHVRLAIYDLLGRRVAILVDETRSAGRYEVNWDASQLSSGVYVFRLESGGQTLTRQMTLIK